MHERQRMQRQRERDRRKTLGGRADLCQALLGAVADTAPVGPLGEVVPETQVSATEFFFFSEASQFNNKQMHQQ